MTGVIIGSMRRAGGVVLGAMILVGGARDARAADQKNTPPVVEVGPAVFQSATPYPVAPKRSDLVMARSRLPAEALHDLGPLSAAERARLAPAERGSGAKAKREKVGISRALPGEVGFAALPSDLAAGASRVVGGGLLERVSDGSLAWTASFSSSGAGALRLWISAARLPAGSLVYVYGGQNQIHGPYDFAPGIRPEGFWTNTVFADSIVLEVRIPAGTAAADLAKAFLVVGNLVHIEHPVFAPSTSEKAALSARPKSDACFVDRSCVTPADWPQVDAASNAVGQLNFSDQGSEYICSGGLINTSPASNIPYLLTANHCFSTQASATSLEVFWQYRTATCNGAVPDENLFPMTLSATLLATADANTSSDYTFVELSQPPPPGSVLLGWTTADLLGTAGLVGYRLSYPLSTNMAYVVPQIFTREQLVAVPDGEACLSPPPALSPSRFLYETDIQGATGGGSSGSPLMLEDLRIIGQEFGACGSNTNDDCDNVNNWSVDGAFSYTFPALKQWLQPGAPGPCVANATTLCLDNARFRVTAFYATPAGASGTGMGVPLTGDSGYFWFFSADNIELVVKVLTGCGVNNKYWVFTGGLTNVGVTLVVEDTLTGASQTYPNPVGTAYLPLQDTNAFACP